MGLLSPLKVHHYVLDPAGPLLPSSLALTSESSKQAQFRSRARTLRLKHSHVSLVFHFFSTTKLSESETKSINKYKCSLPIVMNAFSQRSVCTGFNQQV